MEHPILFNTDMVNAILERRKRCTRRLVKSKTGFFQINIAKYEPHVLNYYHNKSVDAVDDDEQYVSSILCPYGRPDDILWVRETLRQNGELGLEYLANNEWIDERIIPDDYKPYRNYAGCNIPSIYMPKWAARIWLQITDVRVERLQDISEEDAIAEGIDSIDQLAVLTKEPYTETIMIRHYKNYLTGSYSEVSPISSFQTLEESWKENPFVWVIEFDILSTTGRPDIIH